MIFFIPSITSGRMHKFSVQFLMRETHDCAWHFSCSSAVRLLQDHCSIIGWQLAIRRLGLHCSRSAHFSANLLKLQHSNGDNTITLTGPLWLSSLEERDNYEYLLLSPPGRLLKMCPESFDTAEAGCKCHQGSRSQPDHFCHCLILIG